MLRFLLFTLASAVLASTGIVNAGTPPPTAPPQCGVWLNNASEPWLCSDVLQAGAPGQLCAVIDSSTQPYACHYTSCAYSALTHKCEGACASGEVCALSAKGECACGARVHVPAAILGLVIAFGAAIAALVLFSCFWTNGLNR